ncbi:MAG TPA: ABC transporter permease [Smithellaceae bacterium]|nr:ABC transporter permease [Smithellaceae bacterium]HQF84712.1 ABC transporter permease [Smithellaceae bacterium]HQG80938.1 ABC transporter permease [Smithellaceae bacterium]
MTSLTGKQDRPGFTVSFREEGTTLFAQLAGEFSLQNLSAFTGQIKERISAAPPGAVIFDFSRVTYLDSAAALAFVNFRRTLSAGNVHCQEINISEDAKGIFSVIREEALDRTALAPDGGQGGFIQQIGQASLTIARDFFHFVTFLGDIITAFAYTLRHPTSLRGKDLLFYVKRAGVDGLPIVGLIGLLMGLIMAFMAYLQFKQFGANIYVPSLVSFAMVKELGPLMTAILVAGRSGSAYAAEIGTMVVNEEVDALRIMGFDPVRFLAVPKVLATVIVVPILTVYADVSGVIGGMIIGVTSLDLSLNSYVTQSIKAISVFDVVTSMIKAAVFAGLVSAVGCQRGFMVRAGAQDVGKFTTSAVVTAIFMIVVADSIFAIMLYYVRRYDSFS